ncbi:unnamed protein product [Brachionus calyciflorus]|uniref:Integrase catalytic domain-containing protein n=1 Tax=Brachionus calyciflorus TaxID=104777 RepID=A0A813XB34_9BILA|nr:unnamed protein product [Brachionus calyciflorus]
MVGVDILGPFKTTRRGYRCIFIFIDLFTNWVEACALKTLEAEEVVKGFYRVIITRHGCPRKVLTDQGTQFTSVVFKQLCEKFGILKLESSAKHPQTNGKAERFIRFLTKALATVISSDQSDWDELIEDCLLAYLTIISTIQETPFFLIYGREACLPTDIKFRVFKEDRVLDGVDLDVADERNNEIRMQNKIDLLARLRTHYETLEAKRDQQMNYYTERYLSTSM